MIQRKPKQQSSLEDLEALLAERRQLLEKGLPPKRMASVADGQKKIAATVLIDEEDRDMLLLSMRFHQGYIRVSAGSNKVHNSAPMHRIIASRMAGRVLSSKEQVDHLNGVRHDNRRCNLRISDQLGNAHNLRRPLGKTGYYGVKKRRYGFIARVTALIDGKVTVVHRSVHRTAEDAAFEFNKHATKHGYLHLNVLPDGFEPHPFIPHPCGKSKHFTIV